jgi:hypothetical protein
VALRTGLTAGVPTLRCFSFFGGSIEGDSTFTTLLHQPDRDPVPVPTLLQRCCPVQIAVRGYHCNSGCLGELRRGTTPAVRLILIVLSFLVSRRNLYAVG